LEKYVDVFEDTDENKLEYTGIFKEWVSEERAREKGRREQEREGEARSG
jgi:hypothetical protein